MSHHRKPNWASSLLHLLFLLTPRSPGSDILVVTQTSLGFSSPPNNSNSSKLHLRDISSLQSTAAILVLASLPLDNSHILPAALSAPGSSFTTDPWSSTLPKASCELCFKIFHCPSLPGLPYTNAPAWQAHSSPYVNTYLSFIISFITCTCLTLL